jgi:tetratricopeptide (TPR) repeat protein
MYSDFQAGQNSTSLAIRHLHISRIANRNDREPLRSLVELYYSSDSDPGRILAALKVVFPMENDPKTAQRVKGEIRRLEELLETKRDEVKISAAKARKYLSEEKWEEALEEYEKLNAFNASDAKLLLEQGMVYEYLNNEERALDSFYDALLIEEENPELNKNMGNYYLTKKDLVSAILHWARYLETSPKGKEYFSIEERQKFYSHQLKMKSLPKQIFGLSHEQNRHLYKVYRNMKVQLG